MKTMRAVTLRAFGGTDMLQVSEVTEVSVSRPRDVLIRVMASGVNRADVVQRQGHYPPPKGSSEIMGLEVAGLVEKVGEQVKRFKEGDRVMALLTGGGYAQMAVAQEGCVMKIPDGYTFVEAAAIPEAFLTAWQALKLHGNLQKGQNVLVHAAAGGVGTAVMQLTQKYFEATAIATCSTAKVNFCKEFAKYVVDRSPDEAGKCFAPKVLDVVGKNAIDLVIDPVVGGTYLAEDGEVLAKDGKVILLAFMGGSNITVNIVPFFAKRAQLVFSKLRDQSEEFKEALVQSFEAEVLPYMARREIVSLVQGTYNLEDASKAHAFIEQDGTCGKIVLIPRQ
ncbi:oxidoreductase [Trypanosoma rangeli]|uniref:Oxidoreductase n=1 Tax=Trypanosoma rangeli TaxID=5698 RepID=A0A422NF38_TRYRA|nr:oxidoreductase [Trypanosoma rangeli]RNF04056.1 oxidoreductase [Trypanosoma rangeli]|eukprot:RNF04056.1 oxidoreductase [Trypanosoma rangeli]